jgi:hypothetical protein
MFKWLSIKKVTLAAHNWTANESSILGRIVEERMERTEGEIRDWKEISQELYGLN